jgi:hypothetical protein
MPYQAMMPCCLSMLAYTFSHPPLPRPHSPIIPFSTNPSSSIFANNDWPCLHAPSILVYFAVHAFGNSLWCLPFTEGSTPLFFVYILGCSHLNFGRIDIPFTLVLMTRVIYIYIYIYIFTLLWHGRRVDHVTAHYNVTLMSQCHIIVTISHYRHQGFFFHICVEAELVT